MALAPVLGRRLSTDAWRVADPRREARVLAMQALHHLDVQGDEGLSRLEAMLAEGSSDPHVRQKARQLTLGAWTFRERCDRWIQQASEHWDLGRLVGVDRSILRLAIHELFDCYEPPPRVAIDEAIELAKTFGSAESAGFVNGVLDAVWHAHAAESIKTHRE